MITNFKIFESLNRAPKEGDYVLINYEQYDNYAHRPWYEFYKSNIGQIVNFSFDSNSYKIKFKITELPKNFPKGYFNIEDGYYTENYYLRNLKYWSEDKHDLETILSANKYNL